MFSKPIIKRKQSKCLFEFEFQIMKLVQFELFNLMPNSSEIQPNSNQHNYLKFSKTKVGALGHFEYWMQINLFQNFWS